MNSEIMDLLALADDDESICFDLLDKSADEVEERERKIEAACRDKVREYEECFGMLGCELSCWFERQEPFWRLRENQNLDYGELCLLEVLKEGKTLVIDGKRRNEKLCLRTFAFISALDRGLTRQEFNLMNPAKELDRELTSFYAGAKAYLDRQQDFGFCAPGAGEKQKVIHWSEDEKSVFVYIEQLRDRTGDFQSFLEFLQWSAYGRLIFADIDTEEYGLDRRQIQDTAKLPKRLLNTPNWPEPQRHLMQLSGWNNDTITPEIFKNTGAGFHIYQPDSGMTLARYAKNEIHKDEKNIKKGRLYLRVDVTRDRDIYIKSAPGNRELEAFLNKLKGNGYRVSEM